MKAIIGAAAIIGVAIVLAAMAVGGRYQIVRTEDDGALRLDRWTGSFAICRLWADETLSCANAPELYHHDNKPISNLN